MTKQFIFYSLLLTSFSAFSSNPQFQITERKVLAELHQKVAEEIFLTDLKKVSTEVHKQ